MPRKPLASGLVLTAALVTLTACSSGGSTPSSDGGKSTGPGSSTSSTGGTSTKLVKVTGKGDIKNVYAKTAAGSKISLYASSPGHSVMEQIYDATAKTWSAPSTVFKDDTRFCHSIKIKSAGSTIAATVTCSISAQDVTGTQSSYVLGSTDGKTWKRMDLTGADGKPNLSPTGNFASWSTPTSFMLWNPKGSFTTVKYAQSAATPAIGVIQNNGQLLIIKATPGKQDVCTISFQTASARLPTPKLVNSTLPQAGHPKCVASSAKMQGTEVIANFNSTSTTKDSTGKKVTKTTTFAYAFVLLPTGKWSIKS